MMESICPSRSSNRIVKIAAGEAAAKLICASLHIKPEEERYQLRLCRLIRAAPGRSRGTSRRHAQTA
jgi:hypothetical protein